MTAHDQQLSDFIYQYPEIAAKVLRDNGYAVQTPLTLPRITEAMFTAVYHNPPAKFQADLESAIAHEGYSNFLPMLAVSVGMSVFSAIGGAKQAKKARELAWKMEMAKLSQARLLEEEAIRTGAETERTKILLQTLQQYQSDLQVQSTERIKNVWIYVGMMGTVVGILYGIKLMFSSSK